MESYALWQAMISVRPPFNPWGLCPFLIPKHDPVLKYTPDTYILYLALYPQMHVRLQRYGSYFRSKSVCKTTFLHFLLF